MKMKDFWSKNKKRLMVGIVTAIVLAAAFFIGGNGNNRNDIPVTSSTDMSQQSRSAAEKNTVNSNSADEKESNIQSCEETAASETSKPDSENTSQSSEKSDSRQSENEKSNIISEEHSSPAQSHNENTGSGNEESDVSEKNENENAPSHDSTLSSDNNSIQSIPHKPSAKPSTVKPGTSSKAESSIISEKSGPESSKPIHPLQESKDNKNSCTFDIICTTAINSGELDERKLKLLPSDGCIIRGARVSFDEGESAFDVLKRLCSEKKIHLEFSITPLTGAAYIEGINNLYEFDCGSLSGWTYSINDAFPNVGCSEYILSDGDKVEFLYTCNLGADVGNYYRGE